jgi:hypothetical protein
MTTANHRRPLHSLLPQNQGVYINWGVLDHYIVRRDPTQVQVACAPNLWLPINGGRFNHDSSAPCYSCTDALDNREQAT